VPPDFPEIYSFDRLKELPRYLKTLALRAERGSLNLASTQKKMQEVMIYSRKLQQIIKEGIQESPKDDLLLPFYINKSDAPVGFSDDKKKKIDEFFWMIEEYKVSLFAQELKNPYPVSPKKLNQMIKEIEETLWSRPFLSTPSVTFNLSNPVIKILLTYKT